MTFLGILGGLIQQILAYFELAPEKTSAKDNFLNSVSVSEKRTTIKLPDIFHSFLKESPRLNPYYESIRVESENWISR